VLALDREREGGANGAHPIAYLLGVALRFGGASESEKRESVLECAAAALADAELAPSTVDALVGSPFALAALEAWELPASAPRTTLATLLGDTRGMSSAVSLAWAASRPARSLVVDVTLDGGVFAAVVAGGAR